jgi:hypothetical protein
MSGKPSPMMTVADLKEWLSERGLSTEGRKYELYDRATEAYGDDSADNNASTSGDAEVDADSDEQSSGKRQKTGESSSKDVGSEKKEKKKERSSGDVVPQERVHVRGIPSKFSTKDQVRLPTSVNISSVPSMMTCTNIVVVCCVCTAYYIYNIIRGVCYICWSYMLSHPIISYHTSL